MFVPPLEHTCILPRIVSVQYDQIVRGSAPLIIIGREGLQHLQLPFMYVSYIYIYIYICVCVIMLIQWQRVRSNAKMKLDPKYVYGPPVIHCQDVLYLYIVHVCHLVVCHCDCECVASTVSEITGLDSERKAAQKMLYIHMYILYNMWRTLACHMLMKLHVLCAGVGG